MREERAQWRVTVRGRTLARARGGCVAEQRGKLDVQAWDETRQHRGPTRDEDRRGHEFTKVDRHLERKGQLKHRGGWLGCCHLQ
jgi:hypothetical protein